MTKDITNLEDVQLLVDSFYENIRGDELLALFLTSKYKIAGRSTKVSCIAFCKQF